MRTSLAIAALLLMLQGLRAQDPEVQAADLEGQMIAEVRWLGIPAERGQRYSKLVYTQVGTPLRLDLVSNDVKVLWRLYKARASFRAQKDPATGLLVTVEVEEARVLESLVFAGNRTFTRRELLDALAARYPGKIVEEDAERCANALVLYYRSKGHAFVSVTTRVDGAKSELTYEIQEGPRVHVLDVRFHGNQAIPASRFLGLGPRLHGVVESSTPYFSLPFCIGRQSFDQSRVDEDRNALAKLYRSQGYYDVEVSYDVRFSDDRRWASLDFFIEEGRRYTLCEIRIEGNSDISTAELRELLLMRPGDPVTEALISRDLRAIEVYYGKRGYSAEPGLEHRFDIEHQLAPNGDGTMTIVLKIHER